MLKYLDEYRDAPLALEIAEAIRGLSTKPFNIMEVCGGHTMAIRKNGIQKIVGENINLISGPGCPVCVTSKVDIDKAIAISQIEDVALCTFGDMIYVPGTKMSLSEAKARGRDIRTVYSVYDAIGFAKKEKEKKIIFISIGFETTTPTVSAAVKQCAREGISNFGILTLNKTMPAALREVLSEEESKIDALLCPGHVSTITGTGMYNFIVDELGVSCCISGFEPVDMLKAIYILTEGHEVGEKKLANAYERAVKAEGNKKARAMMEEVFRAASVEWRGFGVIPGSGLELKDDYAKFDAGKIFDIDVPPAEETDRCMCGDILRGKLKPIDCKLFKTACTPEDPQGACMVSSEGTCAAWYKYGEL